MRGTKALPAIEVVADDGGQLDAKRGQYWLATNKSWSCQKKKRAHLYSYTSTLGIFSVQSVPVQSRSIECISYWSHGRQEISARIIDALPKRDIAFRYSL